MRIKHDIAVVEQIKKMGIFDVGLELDTENEYADPVFTTVNYGLRGSEETMSMMSGDAQLISTVLDTLLSVSFLMTGEEE